MSERVQNRTICKFNLRGQCRFGKRCRNIHEDPERIMEWGFIGMNTILPQAQKPTHSTSSQTNGACALSPSKLQAKQQAESKQSSSGPSTSSVQHSLSVLHISEPEEKTCGICFDVVLKKTKANEQTFGMLPNCNHCFCFACIRIWRQSKEFDSEVSKACPECRIASDFVYPVRYWIDNKEQKERYISKQKQKMKQIDCRYFRKGKGKCPFGNTCMYLHALPNGQELDVGPPKPRRRSPGSSADDLVHQIVFWLNDEEFDLDTDDEEEDEDFELDLDDPCIAYQYYEPGDIRRYIAWERLIRGDLDDDSDNEMDLISYDNIY